MLLELEADHRKNVAHHVIDIEMPHIWSRLTDHSAYAGNDLAGAGAVGGHPLDCTPRGLQIWCFAVEPAQTGISAAYQASQRLVDLVGDRSGQLAQGRDSRHAGKFGASLERLVLSVLDDANVHHRSHER